MYTNENFVLREPRVLVDCFPFNRAEFTLLPKLKITCGLKSRCVPVFLFLQQNLVSQSPSAVRYSLSPFGPVFDGSSSLGALCSLKPCKKNCQLAKLLVFRLIPTITITRGLSLARAIHHSHQRKFSLQEPRVLAVYSFFLIKIQYHFCKNS